MNVRTVRLTDRRLGEPSNETREVAGYVIEKHVPLPKPAGHPSPLVKVLLAMEVGDSIVHRRRPNTATHSKPVKKSGRTFTSRRLADGRYRIWRIT